MRYFARLSYNGSAYHGWQSQKNTDDTVQEAIETALFTLAREPIKVVGCGRTDTGVHASDYVMHFDTKFDFKDKEFKVNSILPKDIVIYQFWPVEDEYHARFDAISRTYHYKLHTYKNPFLHKLSYRYNQKDLNVEKLNQVANLLIGVHDFAALAKIGSDVTHHQCKVFTCFWQKESAHNYLFTIRANRFLRGMVRLIVGMSLYFYEDKMEISEIEQALQNQQPLARPYSVPPHGLYLSRIEYPSKICSGA